MEARIETIVIGGGQAGLATSWHLTERDVEHVVLERDRIAESWRSRRWDSFTLVTPAWTLRLPGFPWSGEPDVFLHRDQVIDHLEGYAASFRAPVRQGVRVDRVRPREDGGFDVHTEHGDYHANHVVIATGTHQRPRIPQAAAQLPASVFQLHASSYRRPDALPSGAVVVVGAGQSGAQIADELRSAGRDVILSVGRSTRAPRRYRGRDLFHWAHEIGLLDRTVDGLEDPAERFAANPIASGRDGGKELGLHELAQDGVELIGRLTSVSGTHMHFGDNLQSSLEQVERSEERLKRAIDEFVETQGLDAPPAEATEGKPRAGWHSPDRRSLDLTRDDVGSVVWTTGFAFDFSWVEGPTFDAFGYPVTRRGVADPAGLYFVGLHWLHTLKSGLFFGVGDDAAHVAEAIATQS